MNFIMGTFNLWLMHFIFARSSSFRGMKGTDPYDMWNGRVGALMTVLPGSAALEEQCREGPKNSSDLLTEQQFTQLSRAGLASRDQDGNPRLTGQGLTIIFLASHTKVYKRLSFPGFYTLA